MKEIKNTQPNKCNSLEDVYHSLMKNAQNNILTFSQWEKTGDVYKQYSIYDTSKYETMLSSNTIIKK